MPYENNDERACLILIEAELLRAAGQKQQAFDVLKAGMELLPRNPDMVYETGLMAERLGDFPQFEQLMRHLIKLRPDLPHSYNALGYSPLERKQRIDEAFDLIQQARQIAPDDVAIMDSMGMGVFP